MGDPQYALFSVMAIMVWVQVTTTIAALKIFAYQNIFEKANVGYGSAIATVLTLIIIGLAMVFLRVETRNEAAG